MSISKWAAGLLAAVLVAGVTPAPARGQAALHCRACLVVDESGEALYARRAGMRLPNASTTKMVTALVALAGAARDEVVTVSAEAAATPGGGLSLGAGERYTVEDLLVALMLASSNDAAVALAEHLSGSEAAFVDDMNVLAGELGLRDTRFATSHGLDAPGHYSSARDLARIAAAVLARPALARLVASPREIIDGPGGPQLVENRNPLLETYSGAVGVKTGFTAGAREVLVAAARRSGRRLIAVAMGSEAAAADARALLDLGFAALARAVVLDRRTAVGAVVFDPAGAVGIVTDRAVRGMERPDRVAVSFAAKAGLAPPIARGQVIGTVTVTGPAGSVGRTAAVAADEVGEPGSPRLVETIGDMLRAVHRVAQLLGAS